MLRAKSGRNSSAVFRGWRELLLLPKVAVMVGEEWDEEGKRADKQGRREGRLIQIQTVQCLA